MNRKCEKSEYTTEAAAAGFEPYQFMNSEKVNRDVGLERLFRQLFNYPTSPVAEVYEQDR
jgi:hypothetical protein